MSALPPLSSLAKYDDLMRCTKELTAGVAEEQFLWFLRQYESMDRGYQQLVDEAKDLQRRLDDQMQQTIAIDRKLNYARKMLESERKARRAVEREKSQLENKLDTLRTLLLNDNTMRDETRKHLQTIATSSFTKKRKSNHQHVVEEDVNDINSTGSFLSDLSLTQSGDDLLDPKPSTAGNQKWKKHRPSLNNNSGFLNASGKKSRVSTEKRRSTRQSLLDYGATDKIVSQTKLIIPADKRQPIHAESTIESVPQAFATPSTSSSEEDPTVKYFATTPHKQKFVEHFKTPTPMKSSSSQMTNTKFYTPSAPSLDDLSNVMMSNTDLYATVKKKTAAMTTRPHNFSSKTCLKPECCALCSKKIRFGSVGYKCSECRSYVHQDCREKFTVSCLPQSATPSSKSGSSMGSITDYVPNLSPMVPALIVHCVNEIETRGLKEVGLYRISGSERDVKALKEKFLRNNGIPNLAEVDVHVLCGCIKDFLRSLSDRLIPLRMWTMFSNAAQAIPSDDEEGAVNKEVYRAVEKLPQANRDTLAYLIMHFQRIAECPEIKMPIDNFAKIFGPTIFGYSCADPNQQMLFEQTHVQCIVMSALLNIPTDYWSRFIFLDQPTRQEEKREMETYGSRFYSGTPLMKVARKERKFYNTPPYSAISKKK